MSVFPSIVYFMITLYIIEETQTFSMNLRGFDPQTLLNNMHIETRNSYLSKRYMLLVTYFRANKRVQILHNTENID